MVRKTLIIKKELSLGLEMVRVRYLFGTRCGREHIKRLTIEKRLGGGGRKKNRARTG